MKVWNIVKYAIKQSGLNYTQVSRRLNKSKNYITSSIAMNRTPNVETLGTILHVVGWHLEVVSDATGERITIE